MRSSSLDTLSSVSPSSSPPSTTTTLPFTTTTMTTSPGKPGPSALGAHSPTTASAMAMDTSSTWVEEDQDLHSRVASTSTSSQAPDTNGSSGAPGELEGGGGAESGSELSELTEDEGPHPLNTQNTEPTRKRRRGLIPPKPWDWAMRGINGTGDDEDGEHDGNSDGEGGYSHRERQPRSYAEDNDEEEEEEDDENTFTSVRRGRGRPRTRGDDDGSDGSEASQDEEDDDVERSYTSEEDVDGEPEGNFPSSSALSLFPPVPSRSLLQPAYEPPPEDEDDDMDQDSDSDGDPEDGTPAITANGPTSPVMPRSKPTSARGPAGMGAMSALATAATLMDVNSALSAPLLVPSGPTVPQSSSITAGSNVVGLSSPTPSSPASSATPSPTGSRVGSPVVKKPVSSSARRASDAAAKLNASGEAVIGELAALPNGHVHKDDEVDHEDPDAEGSVDLDVDVDLDLDTDIQPHHRAEALDALAMIELKVFIIRDRLLSEKLRELDWEQALVDDGTHPEMRHLQQELADRRDRRLQLAERRQDFELENIRKRRGMEEAAVWSTWKFQRDTLQTDMIADANRKRRKLEREQRALARPVPIRRIPLPSLDAPSTAPTLRDIVRAHPFVATSSSDRSTQTQAQSKSSRSRRTVNGLNIANPHSNSTTAGGGTWPTLVPLREDEAKRDVELIWAQRRGLGAGLGLGLGPTEHRAIPAAPEQGLVNGSAHGHSHGHAHGHGHGHSHGHGGSQQQQENMQHAHQHAALAYAQMQGMVPVPPPPPPPSASTAIMRDPRDREHRDRDRDREHGYGHGSHRSKSHHSHTHAQTQPNGPVSSGSYAQPQAMDIDGPLNHPSQSSHTHGHAHGHGPSHPYAHSSHSHSHSHLGGPGAGGAAFGTMPPFGAPAPTGSSSALTLTAGGRRGSLSPTLPPPLPLPLLQHPSLLHSQQQLGHGSQQGVNGHGWNDESRMGSASEAEMMRRAEKEERRERERERERERAHRDKDRERERDREKDRDAEWHPFGPGPGARPPPPLGVPGQHNQSLAGASRDRGVPHQHIVHRHAHAPHPGHAHVVHRHGPPPPSSSQGGLSDVPGPGSLFPSSTSSTSQYRIPEAPRNDRERDRAPLPSRDREREHERERERLGRPSSRHSQGTTQEHPEERLGLVTTPFVLPPSSSSQTLMHHSGPGQGPGHARRSSYTARPQSSGSLSASATVHTPVPAQGVSRMSAPPSGMFSPPDGMGAGQLPPLVTSRSGMPPPALYGPQGSVAPSPSTRAPMSIPVSPGKHMLTGPGLPSSGLPMTGGGVRMHGGGPTEGMPPFAGGGALGLGLGLPNTQEVKLAGNEGGMPEPRAAG